jgi:hypothetical protein
MYSKVKQYIQRRIQIPDKDLEESFQYSNVQYYKKGDYILRIGQYCTFIGFLNSGIIVSTIIDDVGKEIACAFTYENCFLLIRRGLTIIYHRTKISLPLKIAK